MCAFDGTASIREYGEEVRGTKGLSNYCATGYSTVAEIAQIHTYPYTSY